MTNTPLTRALAEELLYREAYLIDTQAFDAWLELFTDDVEFWMPAWRNETQTTQDPDRELSLIYYRGKRNLEDRVMRLTSSLYLPPVRSADEPGGLLLWALCLSPDRNRWTVADRRQNNHAAQ